MIYKKSLISLSLVLFSLVTYAQYEKLLHKPYREKFLGVHAMYRDLINISDSTQRAKKIDELAAFARKNNDRGLELEIRFFQNFWNAFFQKQPQDISEKKLEDQVILVSQENIDFLKARSLRALAEFYWGIKKNYEKAFEQYLLLDKELQKANPADYPEMARDLMQIGKAYYFFRDYQLAIQYLKRAIVIPENSFNTMVINDARNTLGLSYQYLDKIDSADIYFNKILKSTFKEAIAWKSIAKGNLGANLYYRHQFEKAIPMLENDFNDAISGNDWGRAAGAATILADIYCLKQKQNLAEKYIVLAQNNINKSEQTDRLRLLFPVISKYFALKGDTKAAMRYIDSATVALNNYNSKFSALILLRAQQKVDLDKYYAQLSKIESVKQQKVLKRNFLITFLILMLIFSLWLLYLQNKKTKLKQLDLEDSKHQIKIFLKRIDDNQKLIEGLQSQLNNIDNNLIYNLQQSTILNDEQWISFKRNFEKLHPEFLKRLTKKLPDLSPADIRFIVLTKLDFNPKEMSATLGVGAEAIRQYRLRLRKKLDLNTDTPIEKVVAEI